jgi:capsid protein
MPFNIAAGDSSSYNYASGRLDHQSFFLSNKVELTDIEYEVVERLFDRWIRIRAAKASGIAPEDIDVSLYTHQFVWDGLEHVDPQKEASAAQIRLASGTTTRGREYFKQGLDIDDMDERAAEELGFDTVKEYRQAIAANLFGTQNQALQKMQMAQGQQSQEQRPQVAGGTRSGISAADMSFIEEFVNERIESLMELRS